MEIFLIFGAHAVNCLKINEQYLLRACFGVTLAGEQITIVKSQRLELLNLLFLKNNLVAAFTYSILFLPQHMPVTHI